jgi:hypothetical protein
MNHEEFASRVRGRLDDRVARVYCETYLADGRVLTLNLKTVHSHIGVAVCLQKIVEVCGYGVNGCGRHVVW